MMIVKEYLPEKHKHILDGWFKTRELPSVESKDLPEIGFISYWEDCPMAAIFMRVADGDFAIIDGLVADPDSPKHIRSKAIDAVVNAVLLFAEKMQVAKVICWTANKRTLMRAKDFGFKEVPGTILAKKLAN